MNCDAGSQDGTPGIIDRVAAGIVPVRLIPNAASTYANLTRESGFPGRDESIRNFCLAAEQLQPKVCLILEGQLRSLSPPGSINWPDRSTKPAKIIVVPLYRRHRYEGTLVTNLLYPLTRALYGKRLTVPERRRLRPVGEIRARPAQPIDVDRRQGKFSVDGWMTTAALAGSYRVCHTFLGTRDQETQNWGGRSVRCARANRRRHFSLDGRI